MVVKKKKTPLSDRMLWIILGVFIFISEPVNYSFFSNNGLTVKGTYSIKNELSTVHYMMEQPSFEGRQITGVRKNMRWQLLPQIACGMKEGNITTFTSRAINADTILVWGWGCTYKYTVSKFLRTVYILITVKERQRSSFMADGQRFKFINKHWRVDQLNLSLHCVKQISRWRITPYMAAISEDMHKMNDIL